MISVIIPTIQKTLNILELLVLTLSEDPLVDEILIINNYFGVPLKFNYPKMRVYTPEINMLVNPSWNLGTLLINNNNFVLMNDDLLVCDNFCSKIVTSDVFNAPDTGLIGYSPSFINNNIDPKNLTKPIINPNVVPSFELMKKYLNTGDWGITIFGKRDNYYHIPTDLKIIFGDNYLLYKNLQNNKKNYAITGLPVNHVHSASCKNHKFSPIVCSDIRNAEKYFKIN